MTDTRIHSSWLGGGTRSLSCWLCMGLLRWRIHKYSI